MLQLFRRRPTTKIPPWQRSGVAVGEEAGVPKMHLEDEAEVAEEEPLDHAIPKPLKAHATSTISLVQRPGRVPTGTSAL